MRILNVIQCTNLGGMEQSNLLRLVGLGSLGHQCELVSLHPLGALKSSLDNHQISSTGLEYRGRGGWMSMGTMYREVASRRFDALLMTGHNLAANLAIAPRLAQRRMVLAVHFHHAGVKPKLAWNLIYRIARSTAGAVTFPCQFIRSEAERIFPPIASITHTVPNPFLIPSVPAADDRRAAREALGIPQGAFVVGNAGWLIARKRFDVFLAVARQVLSLFPDALFVVAGDGPEKQSLMSRAADWGIAGRVQWLGWQKDLTKLYQALDVLLFNSDWDALGRTPLEALSFGVPVVSSVVNGGLSEILLHEKHGVVLPEHNVAELAEHVIWAARHPTQARERALTGREHLGVVGSVARHAQSMERLLSGS